MSRKEKLLNKLKSRAKNFTIDELDSLMRMCGCEENQRGKTSGSAKKYIGKNGKTELRIHIPHPQKEIPLYVLDAAIEFLEREGEIQ